MSDFGVKSSKPTFDVGTARDINLSFSSSWPLLKIAHQGRATINNLGVSQTIVTHDLGYPPMFLIFDLASGDSVYKSYGAIQGGQFAVSTTELKFLTFGGAGSSDIYYYIFRLPLNSNFEAPIINTSTEDTFEDNSDYGIKVTKDGYDTSSTDLRDYVIHSGTRMPLIHAVQSGALTEAGYIYPGGKMKEYTHNLGYVPLAFCFLNYGSNEAPFYDTNYWYALGGVGGVSNQLLVSQADSIRIEDVQNPSTVTASFVVMKDPRDGTIEEVTYS